MLALAPQILFGLGEEGGEPIFATSSRLKDLSASPRLHLQHTRISNFAARATCSALEILRRATPSQDDGTGCAHFFTASERVKGHSSLRYGSICSGIDSSMSNRNGRYRLACDLESRDCLFALD